MLLKHLLLSVVLGLGLTAPAYSDAVLQLQDAVLTIKPTACKSKAVLDALKEFEGSDKFEWKEGSVFYKGEVRKACWATDGFFVYLIDEHKAGGQFPLAAFEEQKEV